MEYLSDTIQECFIELINTAYAKNENLGEAICCVSIYLIRNNTDFDHILEKHNGVTKELIKEMVVSNFLELTYYRRKNNIPLDQDRLAFLKVVEESNSFEGASLIAISEVQFAMMINDALLYFCHISPMHSYNVVKTITESEFAKKLYEIYPLAFNEHILTFNDNFTRKEALLSAFIEEIVNATERLDFSEGLYPSPVSGYIQSLANTLKMYNGHNPELPNIHKEIIETFLARTNIVNNPEDKSLMLEIVICTLRAKQELHFPLSPEEIHILSSFDTMDKSLETFCIFFDTNIYLLLTALLNNWNYFRVQELLKDLPEFNISRGSN